ncbi:MAG TPA: hypothetical protein P5560_03710 [Thermotogota bacterium]|nr:hypothetical protein [Thermotogota bacterium]HRW92036.1 hypothetical protein [Thermotogota bacterium]
MKHRKGITKRRGILVLNALFLFITVLFAFSAVLVKLYTLKIQNDGDLVERLRSQLSYDLRGQIEGVLHFAEQQPDASFSLDIPINGHRVFFDGKEIVLLKGESIH